MTKNKRGIIFLCIGLSMFLIAACFYVYNIVEDKNAGKVAEEILDKMDKALEQQTKNPDSNSVIMVDGEAFCGKVIVDKLGVELPVFRDWDYTKLKDAPCRYSGNVATNDLIIAAHNYGSHFGNIKNLVIGDQLVFMDTNGKEHRFAVKEVITLEGIAIKDMLDGDWDFTLFTCTKGGKHRVTVRCDAVPN